MPYPDPASGSFMADSESGIKFQPAEPGAVNDYSLDGGQTWHRVPDSLFVPLPPGEWAIAVRATNGAGHALGAGGRSGYRHLS